MDEEVHLYAIDFFNSLLPSEQIQILEEARKNMRRRKLGTFASDREIKQYGFLLERIDKFLEGNDYTGYDCDILTCEKPAKFYNSNIDAFYCLEHN